MIHLTCYDEFIKKMHKIYKSSASNVTDKFIFTKKL